MYSLVGMFDGFCRMFDKCEKKAARNAYMYDDLE
jgi:hypothetical protein